MQIRSLLKYLFILTIIFNMGNILFSRKEVYFSHDYWTRYSSLKTAYYNSIYANKHGSWLPDEILYAFNGGALISGVSPILVNPEIPPTGKYLIGLSIMIFGNEHIIVYIFGLLSLYLMYLLGRQVFTDSLTALLPPFFITFEPFFRNQFIYTPLLDIFQLAFLLSALYFFNKAFLSDTKNTVHLLLSSVFTGLFISTKFFATGIPIIVSCIVVLLLHKEKKKLFMLLVFMPVSVFILLFSYIRVLIIGYPILKFLGIQKWVYWYNQGHIRNQFSVWPLLLFNWWYQSDNKILHDPQWQTTWPLTTVCSGLSALYFYKNKYIKKQGIEIVILWAILYLVLISLSDASARYFVILLPVLYIISTWGIEQLVLKNFTKQIL